MEVKDIMKKERTVTFIDSQDASPDAAYERIRINRDTGRDYRAKINGTDTAGMPESLKDIYADIFILMLTASEMELEIVKKG